MKRALFILAILVFMAPALCSAASVTKTKTITDGAALAAGGARCYSTTSATDGYVDVRYADGFFGVKVTVAGDGTLKLEYAVSDTGDGYTPVFREPDGASDVITGVTKTSGPGQDGIVYTYFTPAISNYLTFTCVESGGASAITPTVELMYR